MQPCKTCEAQPIDCATCKYALDAYLPTEEEEGLEPYYEYKMKKIYNAYNQITHEAYKDARTHELPD